MRLSEILTVRLFQYRRFRASFSSVNIKSEQLSKNVTWWWDQKSEILVWARTGILELFQRTDHVSYLGNFLGFYFWEKSTLRGTNNWLLSHWK